MKLSIKERLVAVACLPKEGDILFLRLRQQMVGKLGFSDEEMANIDLKQNPDGSFWWREDVQQDSDIDMSEVEIGTLADRLRELSRERKLQIDMMSLYEKIVG